MNIVQPPVIILAYANDKRDQKEGRFLSYLARESAKTHDALLEAEKVGLCKIEMVQNATLSTIESAFTRNEGHVAIFHYAGHSDHYNLLLEEWDITNHHVDHHAFARYLGQQKGLQLVFLNSCISKEQLPAYRESKIPTVLYTNEYISDQGAAMFSVRFYRRISKGDSIQKAYAHAAGLAQASAGDAIRKGNRAIRSHEYKKKLNLPIWQPFYHPDFPAAKEWNLPTAADDRLRLLPEFPKDIGYPPQPYKYLKPYERSDARVYWGRESELLQLYSLLTSDSSQNIVVLSGSAGSGKTSLLQAGLLPRLENHFQIVRTEELRLNIPLSANSNSGATVDFESQGTQECIQVLSKNSESIKKPLLFVIDDFEKSAHDRAQFTDLVKKLSQITAQDYGDHFHVKLLFATRNDYLKELEFLLAAVYSGFASVYLAPPSQRDIIKFVEGIGSNEELKKRYEVQVSIAIPSMIAADLGSSRNALTTPILQILMAYLYDQARLAGSSMSASMYEKIDLQHLIHDFVVQQIKLTYSETEFEEFKGTGLVENILGEYADPLGKPVANIDSELINRYPPAIHSVISSLIQYLKSEARLLVDLKLTGRNVSNPDILIHDFLGPIIKRLQYASNLPGPKAIHILSRITNKDEVLSESALEDLLPGLGFVPVPDSLKNGVIQQSKKEATLKIRLHKRKRNVLLLKFTAIAFLVLALIVPGTGVIDAYGLIFFVVLALLYPSG